jgi:hypothetical protein
MNHTRHADIRLLAEYHFCPSISTRIDNPAAKRSYIPGRRIPSFFIRNWSVERCIPRRVASGSNALLSGWHTLDCNFIDWCSSKYREAQKSAVESLAILLGQYEDNPYLSFSYWISQFVLPWTLLFLGEWGEALRTTKSSIALGIKNGHHIRVLTSRLDQAWIHLQAMDPSGALTSCESVRTELGEPARRPWNRFCRILAGSAELAMENSLSIRSACSGRFRKKLTGSAFASAKDCLPR